VEEGAGTGGILGADRGGGGAGAVLCNDQGADHLHTTGVWRGGQGVPPANRGDFVVELELEKEVAL
jgi:hypothetical protein